MTSRGQSRITFEDTFFKAKFGCGRAFDRVDAVVEALGGKICVIVVSHQGVAHVSNLFLFTATLPLTLAKGEEEESWKKQRKVGDGKHLKVCGVLGCSLLCSVS